jgi:hypothetical protein
MKMRLILKPGQPGTKGLVEKYGDSLLCVRFKYDAESRQRLKTVELIVERTAWSPPPRYTVDTLVPLRNPIHNKCSTPTASRRVNSSLMLEAQ